MSYPVDDQIFITSDLHLFHKGILNLCPETRPFESLDDMHERFIYYINWILTGPVLQKGRNHLYILGDFSFKGKEATQKILERLPCNQITLILGNHDYKLANLYREYFHDVRDYLERKFPDNEGNYHKTIMFHYPILSWNGLHRNSIHFHGHSHGNLDPIGRMLDVGIDNVGEILRIEDAVERCLQRDVEKVDHHG